MSLYEDWLSKAYTKEGRSIELIWKDYLPKEQKIYEYILGQKIETVSGKVCELAKKFNMNAEQIVAFVDGLNDILPKPYEINEFEEDSEVDLVIDFEKLYKKMVEYKAEHLYTLKEWDNIFTEDKRKELYTEQKNSRTVVNEDKVGRNDPCLCGSGKKYKKCCGA